MVLEVGCPESYTQKPIHLSSATVRDWLVDESLPADAASWFCTTELKTGASP